MSRPLVWTGGVGSVLGIICCFTPVLPAVLTGIGTAGLIDTLYRDAVLLPFVGISILMLGTGLWLMRRSN